MRVLTGFRAIGYSSKAKTSGPPRSLPPAGVPVPRARYEVGGIVLADQNLMKDCGVGTDMVAVAQNDALDERICRPDQLDRHGWFSWLVFETLCGLWRGYHESQSQC